MALFNHLPTRTIFIVTFLLFISLSYAQTYYNIDWTKVSSTDARGDLANKELGTCTCDLTAGECDLECCCDSDCTTADISLFQSVCKPNGPQTSKLLQCVDADQLVTVNVMESKALDDMLCVVYDNNPPSAGLFYAVRSAIGTDAEITKYSSVGYSFSKTESTVVTAGSSYKAHDLLTGCVSGYGCGYYVLPGRTGDGKCSNGKIAQFLVDIYPEDNTCVKRVSSLASSCSSLGVPTLELATTSAGTTTYNATVSTVTCPAGAGCAALITTGPVYNAGSKTCSNIVTKSLITVTYTTAGVISAVSADYELSNIVEESDGSGYIPISSGIIFTPSGSTPTSLRYRSGNPGYIVGKPVLGGSKVTSGTKSAINQPSGVESGFSIVGTGSTSGVCDSSVTKTVMYGEDTVSGCKLQIARASMDSVAECQAICTTITSLHNTTLYSYIGSWGNSSNENINDWVAMMGEPATPDITGSSACGWDGTKCTGIPSSAKYEIITAKLGSIGNPQNKILAVRRTYQRENWQWRCWGDLCKAATQDFFVKAYVNFIDVDDQQLSTYVPAMYNPVSFADDIFYPFSIPGPSSATRTGIPIFSLLICIMFALIL